MFRRRWSGLPKDAEFPSSLHGLGYFVNDDDEIRAIDNPDSYFKFFLNQNLRVNVRQRFEFDAAMTEIIHQRLANEGLQTIRLPLGAGPQQPHVPIFASPGFESKSRIVVILGEPTKNLGLLAGRVANGPGGINKGSMVSVVQELHTHVSTEQDASPPGIIISNPGQLYWWPDGGRTLTVNDSVAIPLQSLVHAGRRYADEVNGVFGNKTPKDHISYIFDRILGKNAKDYPKVSVVAIGQSCELLAEYFENWENWACWSDKLDAILLMGTVYPTGHLHNCHFKDFLAIRSRAYINASEPVNTPLAPPSGNLDEFIPALGSPCYSSGEACHPEMALITALKPALQYLQDVATTPDYENDAIILLEKPQRGFYDDDWEKLPDGEKPSIGVVNEDFMKTQLKNAERFRKIVQTGGISDSDSEDNDVE